MSLETEEKIQNNISTEKGGYVALLRKFQLETTITEDSININIGFITTSSNRYHVSIKSREKRKSNIETAQTD